MQYFQSTPSPRRETSLSIPTTKSKKLSIHSLPKEGDCITVIVCSVIHSFNPLPPQGGRPFFGFRAFSNFCFQSTPSPRRETWIRFTKNCFTLSFNPLPPQGGRRLVNSHICIAVVFQSTPSPRRETVMLVICVAKFSRFQSTPSPRRETDVRYITFSQFLLSIHSLPKEGDSRRPCRSAKRLSFQSTPSPRRETYRFPIWRNCRLSFNPLPPQGGRHA